MKTRQLHKRTDPSRPGPSRPGFTLIELLVAIAIINILIGLILPAIVKVRNAAYRAMLSEDLKAIQSAIREYEADRNDLPPTLSSLSDYLATSAPDLWRRVQASEAEPSTPGSFTGKTSASPYYILSHKNVGARFVSEEDGFSHRYRLVAGMTKNPLKNAEYQTATVVDQGVVLKSGLSGWSDGLFPCELSREGCTSPRDPSTFLGFEIWPWDERQAPILASAVESGPSRERDGEPRILKAQLLQGDRPLDRAVYDLTTLRLWDRATELVVPFLEANPDQIPNIRAYVSSPAAVGNALLALDVDMDFSYGYSEVLDAFPGRVFANLLGFGGLDVDLDMLPSASASELQGDPAVLFSYDGLHGLSLFYCSKPGVANALLAKLDEALQAESIGDFAARDAALQSFRNLVSAQSGKALTVKGARALRVLSLTL